MSSSSSSCRRAFSSAPPALLQRLAAKARELVTGQRFVGSDQHGNSYYKWIDSGTSLERRRVVVSGGDHLYDPNRLPPEWRAWLQKTRDEPPSPEEAERADERARVMRARVAAIEERERQRRLARELGGGGGGGGGGGPAGGGGGMARMLQDVQRAEDGEAAQQVAAGGGGGRGEGGGGQARR